MAEEKNGTAPGTNRSEGKRPAGSGAVPDTATEPVRTIPKEVERATALRGLSISRPQTPKGTLRRRTLQDLRDRDPEVPYREYEAASRDLICSLMERQDRMNEEIFLRIIDLEYRMNDLEEELRAGRAGRKNNRPEG